MPRLRFLALPVLLALAILFLTAATPGHQQAFWSQWGRNAQHSGNVDALGQPLNQKIADIIYDPFVEQEKAENVPLFGEPVLTAHYQSTLVDGNSFYMVQKTGTYIPCHPTGQWYLGEQCGPNTWDQMIWNVARYDWTNGQPVQTWIYATDWKPEPNLTNIKNFTAGLSGWEPVFHPALAAGFLYVPGASGTVWKVDTATGQYVSHINPFANQTIDAANTFVSSPLTADDDGNIIYNVLELKLPGDPYTRRDIGGAWLVKVRPDDSSATVDYHTLTPNAPPGGSFHCPGNFYETNYTGHAMPWPPSLTAKPLNNFPCGSQRPPMNLAPAVAHDGTIYTASMGHFNPWVTYMIAVNPDMTLKWATSMRRRLTDGCGVLLPIAPQGNTSIPNSCRFGTTVGFDPTVNDYGSVLLSDLASSTPSILPDGSILMGALENYNFGRGHMMHFAPDGRFLNAYPFGWDNTPASYEHDGTYSIVLKDNHYPGTAYCFIPGVPVCTAIPGAAYYVSQIDPNMNLEWSFQNTTIDSTHPYGYEWCVNAPVIDKKGIVYATSEDGQVYSIPQGHKGVFTTPQQKIFLLEALGAAYTPMAIGEDGKEYSQNNGHLFVIGR